MTGLETTIVNLYEQENCTLEEICAAEDLDEISVKNVLLTHSKKYRAESCEAELVSKGEVNDYIEAYKCLRYSSEAHIQERVLRNLINFGLKVTDGMNANDPKKFAKIMSEGMKGANVLALNNILKEIRETRKKELLAPVIDIETV